MTIFYTVGKGMYVNITNICPCKCTFCIRNTASAVGNCNSLWLEQEPSLKEILAQLAKINLNDYTELVFCGYGEPLSRPQELIAICQAVQSKNKLPIRINTNGLGNLMHKTNLLPQLAGLIDEISISLNAPNSERYEEICQPSFGAKAYPAILEFAQEAKKYIPKVCFTVVDILSQAEILQCEKIAHNLNVGFRVRGYF